MTQILRKNLLFEIISIFMLFPSLASALPTDKKEKLYIVSDASTYNYKTGIKVFEGHVKVDQGTSHLTADKVITRDNIQHEVEELVAYGYDNQAHYWTVPKLKDPVVDAYAKTIKYYPIQSNIVLEQDVYVTQGENSFKGQLVFYNMNDQTITVPASKNARAELIYNPEK